MKDVWAAVPATLRARLAWEIIAGLLIGAWLFSRARARNDIKPDSRGRTVRSTLVVISVFWTLVFLVIALARIRYPYELEWVGGAMRDHVERILDGKPIYTAPTADWIPIEYPPFYYYVCAGLAWLLGGASFATMRLVSILSTFGCARLIYLWVRRRLGAPVQRIKIVKVDAHGRELEETEQAGREIAAGARAWAWIAVGLFFAAYRLTGAWYDLERIDMLFLFLSLLGVYLIELSQEPTNRSIQTVGYATAGGVALSAAVLTKQQALLFVFAVLAALAWRRAVSQLAVFAATVVVVCGDLLVLLNAVTGSWFGYYCFRVPLANGTHLGLIAVFLISDLPLFLPALIVIVLARVSRLRRHDLADEVFERETGSGDELLAAVTVAAVVGSMLSRGHWGGDTNVLIPSYTMLGTAACVAVGRWERRAPALAVPLTFLVGAQMLGLTYRPDEQFPPFAARAAGERYTKLVRSFEESGRKVLAPQHGGFTHPGRFHIMALGDVQRADGGIPTAVSDAIRERRFDFILLDDPPLPGRPFNDLLNRYYVPAETPRTDGPWVVTGYITPPPPGRIYVMRPRPPGGLATASKGSSAASAP